MEEEDVDAVYAMLQYLCEADYEVPEDTPTEEILAMGEMQESEFESTEPPITWEEEDTILHIKVYALADRIRHEGLRALTEDKFERSIAQHWTSAMFPKYVKCVYDVAPPGASGDRLRSIVVQLASEHSMQLCEGEELSKMMEEVADFGRDLVKVLSGNFQFKTGRKYKANGAGKGLKIDLTCPSCDVSSPFRFWAITT
jgi:hypothetical protein